MSAFIGSMIEPLTGLLGAGMMYGANKGISNLANNMPSEQNLRSTFSNSQGLIDRMTNFNQYSGDAMDLATQEGNQGVETSLMSGLGGSQSNAIKNRMNRSAMTDVYKKYNDGLQGAVTNQMNLDNKIFGRKNTNRDQTMAMKFGQLQGQMNIGESMLPSGGLGGLLGHFGDMIG